MTLLGWLRKINSKPARSGNHSQRCSPARGDATVRPCLERLEDRLALTAFDTVTSAAISITPNFFGLSATETVTASVMQQGTTTAVTNGNVAFNVNNQTGTAALNGNGQATFSVTLPLFAVATNQTLQVSYQGGTNGSNTYNSSVFLAPVYLNLDNEFFPAKVTYGTPTNATSFQSSGGETDALSYFGFPITFNYADPGSIQTINWGAFTLPGAYSIFFGVPQLG
ncbi:MAG TPA: hypothetical protein VMF69_10455 [Gemmataceae bacterium]|nr:hypothetical protein [Gemmataceae bacterium]